MRLISKILLGFLLDGYPEYLEMFSNGQNLPEFLQYIHQGYFSRGYSTSLSRYFFLGFSWNFSWNFCGDCFMRLLPDFSAILPGFIRNIPLRFVHEVHLKLTPKFHSGFLRVFSFFSRVFLGTWTSSLFRSSSRDFCWSFSWNVSCKQIFPGFLAEVSSDFFLDFSRKWDCFFPPLLRKLGQCVQ